MGIIATHTLSVKHLAQYFKAIIFMIATLHLYPIRGEEKEQRQKQTWRNNLEFHILLLSKFRIMKIILSAKDVPFSFD